MKLDIGSSPRILITRLSAVGDCVHTLPVANALRDRFPRAHIAWVTQPANAMLLAGQASIDEVITVQRDWLSNISTVRATRSRLRGGRYDLTIDPQGLTKSSLLAWLSGARRRIGFARGQAREVSPWLNTHRVAPAATHVVDRYLELLRPLGIDAPEVRFDLPPQAIATEAIRAFLKQTQLAEFALLNPGAGWESKRWPPANYADVASHLWRRHRLPSVVLWSGDRERAWAEQIVDAADGGARLAPSTSLPELAAICAEAKMFVGSDTGPLHIAAAQGTPCIGMYGPTRVCDCGPYGVGHQPLQAYHQDGTSRERRGDDNRAMRAISVGAVNAACDRAILWQTAGHPQPRVA